MPGGCRVYVGNLPINIREREIEDLFYKYGRIRDIDLKTPSRPPAFAFVVFEDPRDAEDAIRGRDGYNFDGDRLRVELAKGERGGGGDSRGGGFGEPRRKTGGGRRTDYGVVVTNLPKSCSWQDLKDFMRKAGDVVYTDVNRDGEGIVEYSNREDMENAVRKLDDTEFKNPFDSTYIRIKFAKGQKDDRDSRDRGDRSSRGGGKRDRDSRSRSPASRSRSRSRDARSTSASRDRAKVKVDDESPPKRKYSDDEDAVPVSKAAAAEDSD